MKINIVIGLCMFSWLLLLKSPVHGQPVIYYSSDFENDNGGMSATGCWECLPVMSMYEIGPDTAHSDFRCWSTVNDGSYPPNELARLQTPEIDLSAVASARLTFWHWYEMEADAPFYSDGGTVLISTDGINFEVLTPFRGYDGILVSELHEIADQPVFSGMKDKFWQPVVVNLDPYAGQKIIIRFEMISDASVQYAGWYIDDVVISENLADDPALWSILNWDAKFDLHMEPYAPIVQTYNAGSRTLTFDVTAQIRLGETILYQTIQTVTSLKSDELRSVEFADWYPTESGVHDLSFFIRGDNDEDLSNDTLYTYFNILDLAFSEVTAQIWPDSLYNMVYAWEDYNLDGYLDLYIGRQTLIENDRQGNFIEGPDLPDSWSGSPYAAHISAAWGDYDNDGDPDLFVPNLHDFNPALPGNLLRNEGGNFTNVTDAAGFDSVEFSPTNNFWQACWFDYDNDGNLDLYISLYEGPNKLYENQGDGTFLNKAREANIDIVYTARFSVFDHNNDRYPDIYIHTVSADSESWGGIFHSTYKLYQNSGSGSFTDITDEAGLTGIVPRNLSIADFNNDGFLDLHMDYYRTYSAAPSYGYNIVFVNNANGIFTRQETAGILTEETYAGGAHAADVDNDGYLDILLNTSPDLLTVAKNVNGSLIFEEEEMARLDDRQKFVEQPLWIDYDRDGDMDLHIISYDDITGPSYFFRNNGNENHWLAIYLSGQEGKSNARGIGTRLLLINDGIKQTRYVMDLPVAHFGLGPSPVADSILVFWPSGITDTLLSVSGDRYITIKEGSGIINGFDNTATSHDFPDEFILRQNYPNPFNAGTEIQFNIPARGLTTVEIFNILGQKITSLIDDKTMEAGTHRVHWNGRDSYGKDVSSGIYLCRIRNDKKSLSRKMLLIR